jgi:hypothetical protein
MIGARAATGLTALTALLFLVMACGGGSGESVSLVWRPAEGGDLHFDPAAGNDAALHRTTVYVSNDTDDTLRDASIRFHLDSARNVPAGFRVGTVAPISSRFEGADQLWSVGDLKPGAHVAVPLSLWFDLDVRATQSHPVELTLALVSRDLPQAVESNPLRVRLAP